MRLVRPKKWIGLLGQTLIASFYIGYGGTAIAQCSQSDQIGPSPNIAGNTINNMSTTACNGLAVFDNYGTINNTQNKSFSNIAGTITNFSGAALNNLGGEVINGWSYLYDPRASAINDKSKIVNSAGATINVQVSGSSPRLYNYGTIWNNGAIDVNKDGSLYSAAFFSLGRGTLYNSSEGTITIGAGGSFGNSDVNTVLENQGVITTAARGRLANIGAMTNFANGTINNSGSLITKVALTNNGTINSNGLLRLDSGTLVNSGTIQNSGVLWTSQGSSLENSGQITNSGEFLVSGELEGSGVFTQSSGRTIVNGSLAQAAINVFGGTLEGNGTITGAVNMAGSTISGNDANVFLNVQGNPSISSDQSGQLTIDGHLSFEAGTLLTEIGGLAEGDFDVLRITSGVEFSSGRLAFSFINGFLPSNGDSWLFLDSIGGMSGWENLSRTFYGVNGYEFAIGSVGNGLMLSVISGGVSNPPSPVGEIPEPETYAMLLTGLGLLGFMTRRRKQKAGRLIFD